MFLLVQRSGTLRKGISVLNLTPETGIDSRIRPITQEYLKLGVRSGNKAGEESWYGVIEKNAVEFKKRFDLILHDHIVDTIAMPLPSLMANLAGFLKETGYMFFSVPIKAGGSTTENMLAEPSERKELFGREDRIRQFGSRDVQKIFREILPGRISIAHPEDFLTDWEFESYGIPKPLKLDGNTIFVATNG